MLANGIKLEYSTDKGTKYTELAGLKEVPEMGSDPEKVENTCLSDKVKRYEYGISDYGDLEYKFKYENEGASSPYRVLRKLAETKAVVKFKQTYPDKTTFIFDAQCNVKLGGGGVNGVIDFTLALALQSEIAVTDPS